MTWAELCEGAVTKGENFVLPPMTSDEATNTFYERGISLTRKQTRELINAANHLEVPEPTGGKPGKGKKSGKHQSGIGFTIARVQRNEIIEIFSKFVGQKTGAKHCYEDSILPLAAEAGDLLIHQSLAPCERCRTGYKNWAKSRGSAIFLAADEGYDQTESDATFIFTPTARVLKLRR